MAIAGDGFARVRLDEVPARAARMTGELRPWIQNEREAMGEMLLTFPWRIYCTWTFRDRIGEEGALKEIQRWLQLLSFGFGREVGWMVGIEQEHGAPWPHAHGLVCGEGVSRPATFYEGKAHQKTVPMIEPYWVAWKDRHGSGKFEVIVGGRACAFYCAKYASKRGSLVFSANLHQFRGRGASLSPMTLFPQEARDGS